jgi:hypothetical protein
VNGEILLGVMDRIIGASIDENIRAGDHLWNGGLQRII